MPTKQWRSFLLLVGLLTGLLLPQARPAAAQPPGCLAELPSKQGAQLTGEILERDAAGGLRPVAGPATRLQLRSGQVLRLVVRPLEGPDRPAGAGCPVKVAIGELEGIAKLLSRQGFVLDRGAAYGEFRPGEERVFEFEMKPFEEWTSPREDLELENLVIELPETFEFIARLPAPASPPPGSICADVVYADAQAAAGVTLNLRVPVDGPPLPKVTGADGRACWDGLNDPTLYGEVAVDPAVPGALGQSKSRYVSPQANYRLFVVKRPR